MNSPPNLQGPNEFSNCACALPFVSDSGCLALGVLLLGDLYPPLSLGKPLAQRIHIGVFSAPTPLSVSPSVCAVRRLPHSSPLLPGLALLARAAWLAVVSAKPQTRNEAGTVSRWLLGRPEAAQGLGAGEAAESEEMLAGPAQGSVSLHGRDPCPQLSVSGLPGVTPTLPLSGLEIASPP